MKVAGSSWHLVLDVTDNDPNDLDSEDIVDTDAAVIPDDAPEAEAAPPEPRRGRRRRVRTGVRPKVLARRELKLAVIADNAIHGDPNIDEQRPRTRGDCAGGCRPCPWVGCKYHMYLAVNPENGSLMIAFPDLEPWELKETCVLDVADRGGITLEEVGEITNLTRERIRQVEVKGLRMLRESSSIRDLK